ncbi:MAG: NUDIX domain-containing protein [Planctomycetota bacterium]|nr:NUDIX domain-containing protein [Planctomycetota bacterium]
MWHLRARFCPLCAAELAQRARQGRARLCCTSCDFVLYANPASAAAGLVLDGDGRVLLVRRSIPPHRGQWALPAGYQERDEEPRQAAEREILEETGLRVRAGRLLDLLFIAADERKPANVAVFLCAPRGGELCAGCDASEVAWFAPGALPQDLGFGNGHRIRAWLASLDQGAGDDSA